MVNSNPETVSTDFNVSDSLYREPLTVESLKAIMQKEGTKNIIVQLGGRSMSIAYTGEELLKYLDIGITLSEESPVLVDQFLEDVFEYDLDAVSYSENVYIAGIMQHIEAAGIHSGDSACVFPSFKSTRSILTEMKEAAVKGIEHLKKKEIKVRFLTKMFAA